MQSIYSTVPTEWALTQNLIQNYPTFLEESHKQLYSFICIDLQFTWVCQSN